MPELCGIGLRLEVQLVHKPFTCVAAHEDHGSTPERITGLVIAERRQLVLRKCCKVLLWTEANLAVIGR